MTPWQWWWLEEGGDGHGGWCGGHDTREQAIQDAQREVPSGASFYVMEARSSESLKYEGSDCVPFLRVRGKEFITNGPKRVQDEDR